MIIAVLFFLGVCAIFYSATESAGLAFLLALIPFGIVLFIAFFIAEKNAKSVQAAKKEKVETLKEENAALFETANETGFVATNSVYALDGEYFISVDSNAKMLLIKARETEYSLLNFSDLLNFELVKDGQAIISGNTGSAAVGAALFGVEGAIIGASAEKTITKECSSMQIIMIVNSFDCPRLTIPIIEKNTSTFTDEYAEAEKTARDIIALLTVAENNK